jgi:seryl-tRNA synthetase
LLDLKLIRADPGAVLRGAAKKRIAVDLDRILDLDRQVRERSVALDAQRAQQNEASKAIGKAPPAERAKLAEEQKRKKAELKASEEELAPIQKELADLLLRVPNLPAAEVPEGKDDTENVEVKRQGEPRRFEFEALDHVALSEAQGWLEIDRAARLSGSRNYVLRGDLSLLESATMRFALDLMVGKGFVPLTVPTLVRSETMVGTGYFPGGEEQAYRCDERDDLVLVGTAEVPVTALHAGEILDAKSLPMRYVAQSSCAARRARTARTRAVSTACTSSRRSSRSSSTSPTRRAASRTTRTSSRTPRRS